MAVDIKVPGALKTLDDGLANVSGVWKSCDIYARVSGVWKLIHSPGFALFGGGLTTLGGWANVTEKYLFNGNTVAIGTVLAIARADLAASGNLSVGIFGSGSTGSNVAYTDKYTYSGNVVTAGAVLGGPDVFLFSAAAGNSTRGIFGGGWNSLAQVYTNKYTYSGDIVAAGTVLGVERAALAAVGNETVGIFAAGSPTNLSPPDFSRSTDKYTYSSDAVAIGGQLATTKLFLVAAGNGAIGIFSGGETSSGITAYSEKYTYSGNTVAPGTVLGVARKRLAAAGDPVVGIFGGGFTTINVDITDKYTYSGDTVAAGAVLGAGRRDMAATSSRPGGF